MLEPKETLTRPKRQKDLSPRFFADQRGPTKLLLNLPPSAYSETGPHARDLASPPSLLRRFPPLGEKMWPSGTRLI